MINRSQSRVHTPSFIPKFSDPDLLRVVLQSNIWKSMFMRKPEALWTLLKALFYLKSEMFIAPLRAVLRHSFGKRTTGIFITLMSTLMIIGFNANTPWGLAANIFPIIMPILPFFMEGSQITESTFGSIHSVNMVYFWIGYLVIATIHLVRINRVPEAAKSPTRRGSSWLYDLGLKKLGLSEELIQLVLEPILVLSLGWFLWHTQLDTTVGLFLLIGGGCLFFQELQDAVMRYAMRS